MLRKCLICQKYVNIMSCVCTPGYKQRLVTDQFTFFPRRRLISCSRKPLIEQEATLWLKCQMQLKWKEDLFALCCCVLRVQRWWKPIHYSFRWPIIPLSLVQHFLCCSTDASVDTSCPAVIFPVRLPRVQEWCFSSPRRARWSRSRPMFWIPLPSDWLQITDLNSSPGAAATLGICISLPVRCS